MIDLSKIKTLAINPQSSHPEDFFQITNISNDGTAFDFMGIQHVSIYNLWAKTIIQERAEEGYYDDIDYDLTPDDLDRQDISAIIMGELMLKHETLLKSNDVLEREDVEDMTKAEIDQYLKETYKIESWELVQKDAEIVRRHNFIQEALAALDTASTSEETNNDISLTEKDITNINNQTISCKEGSLSAEEQLTAYTHKVKNDTSRQSAMKLPHVDLLENEDIEDFKKVILMDYGDLNDSTNYVSFSSFFKLLLDDFDSNKQTIKDYVMSVSQAFNIPPKNKKIYKGVLQAVIIYGNKKNVFGKQFFQSDVQAAFAQL